MSSSMITLWTTDRVIEYIQATHTTFMRGLLERENLEAYLMEQFDVVALSAVKTEFLLRDMRAIADAPLDLVHYAGVIRLSKENASEPDQALLHTLLHAEVRPVILKYIA